MKLYFIASILIGLGSFLPFCRILKTGESQFKKLVILVVLVAVSVAGRYALSMFPNVKPMAAIAIISGIAFDAESGFFTGAFSMFTSNILFGQGPWTPWQMFAMGLVGFFSGVLFSKKDMKSMKKKLRLFLVCIYGFFSVLLFYGGIMNPASLLMSSYKINRENLVAIYLSGLPMDLVHAGSTVVFLALGTDPLLKKINRLKRKW